ncbi:histidine kinase [Emticicia sp. C21]|uniref:tetratricopeptide repeat-containing sensor histidine kinase n=1 Tax=Emticicia sp. C21 TaxID=2302915 RepID=UPI000E345B8B|nr:histidine kinase [Emticicia sp. C21]RFS15361.1 hypothetical protein D0T08_17730 [Emticicia sp. C21]
MKKLILLTLLCLGVTSLSAQSKKQIDSLRLILSATSKVVDTTLVNIYCQLGKEFIKLKSDSTIYYLQKALTLAKASNYNLGLLKTYIQFGQYYSIQFLPAKAIEYWFKALVIAERLKLSSEIGYITNRLAEAYMSMGDYNRSLTYFKKYAAMCKIAGKTEAYLLSLNSIGTLYFSKKDYIHALRYFRLCDSLNKDLNSAKAQTAALINIGKTQVELKNYDEALERFKKAIRIEDNYIDRIAFVGNEIAKVYLLQNNNKEALRYANLAQNNIARTSARMNRDLAKTLSKIHERIGNLHLAYKYHKDYTKISLAEDSVKNAQLLRLVQLDYENEKSNERIAGLNLNIQERQSRGRMMTGGMISLLLLVIIIAVYSRSLSNKNKLIEIQKTDIQQLNGSLENKVAVRTEELMNANKELIKKNQEIKEAMLKGQTMERERVASELHDNIGSTLSALKWRFEALDRNSLSEKEKKIYDGILRNMHKAYGEIRLISHNMLPAEFEERGLIGALEKFVTDLNTSSSLSKTTFLLDNSSLYKVIRQDVALELYICCFETINNSIKHAEATEVAVILREKEGGDLEVIVKDNGKGFSDTLNNNGKGLKNINNRLERINAKLSIISAANEGSRIVISVPESLWETHNNLTYI